ncbi:MAG: ABC transporter substrate-binding protein [Desulfurococcales archaeon]|nr:ABC transporter substrate-binding protein [Desulfurococcales archaeon]
MYIKNILLAIILVAIVLPSASIASHAITPKGPASDNIVFNLYTADELYSAFVNGSIDYAVEGYIDTIDQDLANQLESIEDVRTYHVYHEIYDILLNPAPVYTKEYNGTYTISNIAEMEGIPEYDIVYINVSNNITYVEFGAYPGKGINPFAFREFRFAMNYLVNRDLFIRNLFSGQAIPSYFANIEVSSLYAKLLPEAMQYSYYESLGVAREKIRNVLERAGAIEVGGKWYYYGNPINVSVVIRIEDERKQIGDAVADNLEKLGFNVQRLYYSFYQAYINVFNTDPMNLSWHVYTEGWNTYISDINTMIYLVTPSLGLMPGFQRQEFWNYHNETIDHLANELLTMSPSDPSYLEYYKQLLNLAINESVRIFVLLPPSYEAYRTSMQGMLTMGYKETYLGNFRIAHNQYSSTTNIGFVYKRRITPTPWNLVRYNGVLWMDMYSTMVMDALVDPLYYAPASTSVLTPFRANYSITRYVTNPLQVPADAITWDAENGMWIHVDNDTLANVKVVLDLNMFLGSKWHDGSNITLGDVLSSYISKYISYFNYNNIYYNSLKGIRILPDQGQVEVYLNLTKTYLQDNYILEIASPVLVAPAELNYLQYYLVYINQSYGFPYSGKPEINLLDSQQMPDFKNAINYMLDNNITPTEWFTVDNASYMTDIEWRTRLQLLLNWVNTYNLSFVSQGPYMLTGYNATTLTFNLTAFRDSSYPYTVSDFEEMFADYNITPPKITGISNINVTRNQESTIDLTVSGSSPMIVSYAVRDPSTGATLFYGLANPSENENHYIITITPEQSSILSDSKIYELVIYARNPFPILEYASAPIYVEPDGYTSATIQGGESGEVSVNSTTTQASATFNTTGNVEVSMALYDNLNETGIESEFSQPVGYGVDFYTNNTDAITWPIHIEVRYNESTLPEGVNESQLAIYYYNKTLQLWEKCSSTGVDVENNIVWANMTIAEYESGIGNMFTVQEQLPVRKLTVTQSPSAPIMIKADETAFAQITVMNIGELDEQVVATAKVVGYVGNVYEPVITVSPNAGTIPVNGSMSFNISVIPNGVGAYFIAVNISSIDGEASAEALVTVNSTDIIYVIINNTESTILDNETAEYYVGITNIGATSNTFNLTAVNGELNTSQLTLSPNESKIVKLTVSGQPGVINSTVYIIWSENSHINRTIRTVTYILERYRFNATLMTTQVIGEVNKTTPVHLKLTNLGALSDTYLITSEHATTPLTVTLNPNNSKIIEVNLTYPSTGFYTEHILIKSTNSTHNITFTIPVEIGEKLYEKTGTGTLVVNATQANATVKVQSSKPVVVDVLLLNTSMLPEPAMPYIGIGLPFDLLINDTTGITYPVIVNITYSSSIGNKGILIPLRFDYNSFSWVPFHVYTVNRESNTVTIYIQPDEISGVPILLSYYYTPSPSVGGKLVPNNASQLSSIETNLVILISILTITGLILARYRKLRG